MLQGSPVELVAVALIGVVLAGSLGNALIRWLPQLNRIMRSLSEGAFLWAILSVIVVALGLCAWILTPILPLLVLVGALILLPIKGRARIGFLIIGCLSIGLGA